MPFVLIIIGIVLLVTAINGTTTQLGSLLYQDVFPGGFIYWVIAILIVGALGYIPTLKKLSDAFLALIVLVLFLSHKGFFSQFNQAVKTSTSALTSNTNTALASANVSDSTLTNLLASPSNDSLVNGLTALPSLPPLTGSGVG